MKDLAGQLAFITGGASGAGFGQAQVFGRLGCRIVIADIRAEAVEEAAAALKAEGIEVHGIQLDITDRAAYAAAADEVEQVFGQAPTLLFNTAGVNNFGPIESTTYGDFDWLIGVNLGGVVNGMVTFVPRMIASGKPCHITTVASLGGFTGSALAGPYSAAKAAVINLMEGYRQGLDKYGIGVSVVCPANIKSNIARATLTRSAAYGESGYVEGEEAIASLDSIYQHGMEPTELAENIRRGIEDNALYIIPYPETKDMLAAHFAAILDSIPGIETDPEGAKKRTEALMEWAQGGAQVFVKGKA
ncbi:SDR family NAD(P)-dependent oxidoreductase [Novosphingobium sp.]|uniref:SDR family NAD(P)-dependent oxidoreductase n=1 Tax=Novosphingobium sp. TaxID=1874826 RepID=UPI0035AF8E7E